jgi:hypothetical protein
MTHKAGGPPTAESLTLDLNPAPQPPRNRSAASR